MSRLRDDVNDKYGASVTHKAPPEDALPDHEGAERDIKLSCSRIDPFSFACTRAGRSQTQNAVASNDQLLKTIFL